MGPLARGTCKKNALRAYKYGLAINLDVLCFQNLPKHDKRLMAKYGKVVGYFDGTIPNLWTTDADLIKSVFVKEFDHFINRRVNIRHILY